MSGEGRVSLGAGANPEMRLLRLGGCLPAATRLSIADQGGRALAPTQPVHVHERVMLAHPLMLTPCLKIAWIPRLWVSSSERKTREGAVHEPIDRKLEHLSTPCSSCV